MKVILFGATGMVGPGVLRECLIDNSVEVVLAVGRSSTGRTHPKLLELVRKDLFDFGVVDADLQGYDACFYCLGVSVAGMNEADYTRLTFDLTLGWAQRLAVINPAMTFVYVSGASTGGKAMWAQVKLRTEDALLTLCASAYMVRLEARCARCTVKSPRRAGRGSPTPSFDLSCRFCGRSRRVRLSAPKSWAARWSTARGRVRPRKSWRIATCARLGAGCVPRSGQRTQADDVNRREPGEQHHLLVFLGNLPTFRDDR